MVIHYVYSVPPGKSIIEKVKKRAVRKLQRVIPVVSYVGNREKVDTSAWPVHAPISITSNVYRMLKERYKVLLYDWREEGKIGGGKGDILIGHPCPGNERSIWNRSCREGEFALRIAMTPLSHHMAEVCGRLEPYIPLVDGIIGIMGKYWFDTWQFSPLAHWKSKIYPMDMAIDIQQYPRIKMRFNPPGKRKFFYIGYNGPQKGTHLLSILFGLAPQHKCIWIGKGDDLPNIEHRPRAEFSQEYVASRAEECDFFITMGVSDANPTTILESMAWGFPTCCTPQSGYRGIPEITELSITDMEHNVKILNKLQNTPEEELIKVADASRRLVHLEYSWARFEERFMKALRDIGTGRGVTL